MESLMVRDLNMSRMDRRSMKGILLAVFLKVKAPPTERGPNSMKDSGRMEPWRVKASNTDPMELCFMREIF